jgi:hypothetical protein
VRAVLIALLSLGSAVSKPVAGRAAGVADDKSAIMDVIERQAAAFWAKDFERWAATWVHADYVRRVGWSPTGGVVSVEGWDAIGGAMKTAMRDNPAPNPTPARLVRDHINVRVYGDAAWVTFVQRAPSTGEARFDMAGVSHETRFLERHNGRWQLVYVGYVLAEGRKNSP